MVLKQYFLKVEDIINNLISGSAGLDAILNLYSGISTGNERYYQLAIIEGLISVGIQVSKYFNRKKQETLDRLVDYIPRINKMKEKIDRDFQKLFYEIDNYTKNK